MNSEKFSPATEDDSQAPHSEWPLVSVIVATHNRPVLLARALDSVLAQTFKDYECWVVHDGPLGEISDEGVFTPKDETCAETARVFGEYSEKFDALGIDFFTIASDEHTGYYCTPRNLATENSRGVYVAKQDDDNEWLPDTISSLVEAMDEGEMWPDIVYGRRRYIIDDGCPVATKDGINLRDLAGDSPYTPWDDMAMVRIAGNMPAFNLIDSSEFLVAKGALYRLGIKAGHIWDDSRRRFGDFYLVSDGLHYANWRFKGIDKIVQLYHLTGDNISLTRPAYEVPREVQG